MTPIFPQFTNLEALELFSFTLTDKLNNAYCLKLLSFTITNLAFSRGDGPLAPLGPILLPNLTAYIGPSSFLSSFGGASRTIVCVVLLWYPDDLNVDIPLLHLSKAAALDTIIAIATSEDLSISTILRDVTTHLPRIKTVKIMTPRLSRTAYSKSHLSSNTLTPLPPWRFGWTAVARTKSVKQSSAGVGHAKVFVEFD
ncbi:hypothetical protein B0H14DRAFT_3426392 [Mycena olivaceomarginata]|nr:hypothetical protein B0H14DRAFT_3426392 [Mycena olivaceomarginata]